MSTFPHLCENEHDHACAGCSEAVNPPTGALVSADMAAEMFHGLQWHLTFTFDPENGKQCYTDPRATGRERETVEQFTARRRQEHLEAKAAVARVAVVGDISKR